MSKTFEELPVWQKSRELVKNIYSLTMVTAFNRDYGLADQVRRACTSIMSNIAEGFERGSNIEFIQFLYIAKGSAGETRTQLYIAHDLNYISDPEFETAYALCKDISGQISGLIDYLKGSRLKGDKFRKHYKSMQDEVNEFLEEFNNQDSKFNKSSQY